MNRPSTGTWKDGPTGIEIDGSIGAEASSPTVKGMGSPLALKHTGTWMDGPIGPKSENPTGTE